MPQHYTQSHLRAPPLCRFSRGMNLEFLECCKELASLTNLNFEVGPLAFGELKCRGGLVNIALEQAILNYESTDWKALGSEKPS